MRKLNVKTSQSAYDIFIYSDNSFRENISSFVAKRSVVVITNTTVADIYLEELVCDLEDADQVVTIVLPDGEQYKNLDTMKLIYDELMKHSVSRDSIVVALGGGVIGDMAGFAAASYQRGVDFIQVPTTLLAQVDSSVGGKTGVNHELGKNMIGAFKQPKAVIINNSTLQTLPIREISAGIAEIIKYALINDYDFFCWLEKNIEFLVNLEDKVLTEAIYRSCEHKSLIVAQDEFEGGVRALLNLGHTFGHAIENYLGYGDWLHGEAVAMGMIQAAYMSMLNQGISKTDFDRIVSLIHRANLPVTPPSIPVESYLELMSRDKKVLSGNIRLVLLESMCQATITDSFDIDLLRQTLSMTSFV